MWKWILRGAMLGIVLGWPVVVGAATIDGVEVPGVPRGTVEAASASPLIRFNRHMKGGAYTDGAWSGGGSIVLAFAAWEGDASADKRLLEQMRLSLTGDATICANGGYPAQHERHVTGMFALAKMTPRVWGQLTEEEKHKVDLIMEAALVGSAYTTADATNEGKKKPTALDGDDNLNRGWNPNYREGMVGEMIVGTVYFGGGAEAEKILDAYDPDAFLGELKAAGLTNLYETFHWKADHPESKAPTGAEVKAGIAGYRYMGADLSDPLAMYCGLTKNTYGGKVSAGLNGGKGINGAGVIATGAEGLPNVGKEGELLEFGSMDAGGARSSITYAYDGFRPNLTDHVVLLAGGYWKKTAETEAVLQRMDVGVTDLFYKLEHGYVDCSKGHASREPFDIHAKGWSFEVTRDFWEKVVRPWHVGNGELRG